MIVSSEWILNINRMFDLRNKLVHLLTSHFFVLFVEWNVLMHPHLISHANN